MRYGVISDIHSNLEALEVVLDALGDADSLVCLGDIVGYGPDPNECCDIVRERGIPTVIGNHDSAAVGRMPLDWFNPYAREAVEWTQERLTDESRSFLNGLPLTHEEQRFIMVHGSLNRPEDFEYITSLWTARPTFAEMETHALCFIGHTHVAELYVQKAGELSVDQIGMASGGVVDLRPGFLYIVNCGGVGQPRDGNSMAACGVYDTEAQTIEFRRLEYPVESVQRKMRDAGLPRPLRERLEYGA